MSPIFNTQSVAAFNASGDQELRFNVSRSGRTVAPDITTVLNKLSDRTLTALAIGPMSDTDQVQVEYALGEPISNTVSEGAAQRRQSTILSVGYPLDFGLRGPIDINIILGATPVYGLSVAFKMPGYSDTMLPVGSEVAVPFTGMSAVQGRLFEPSLELIAAFDGRRLGGIGTVRHAKRFTNSTPVSLDAGVYRLFVPVFGRRHVRAFFRQESAGAALPASYSVQMAYVSFFDGNATVPGVMREMFVGAPMVLNSFGDTDRFLDEPQAREDFIEARIEKTGNDNDTLRMEIVVSD
jgi:hypothetical protein